MLGINFFGGCNHRESVYNELHIDVSEELHSFLVTGNWDAICSSLSYKHSLLMNTKFSQIGKLVDKNFILLSNGSFSKIRFSRKQVIEIDADNRRRYMAYIDYVHGAIACLADNSSEEKDKQFLEAIESQFSLISHCMNNEFYRFMQFAPGANDFDTENFVISGLFGIKNGQIFIEWEGEDILIAEEILDPTNLLASGIYGIGEAKHEGIISNDCYTYFMDLVSSFKPEIKPLKSEIFKKKVKIS